LAEAARAIARVRRPGAHPAGDRRRRGPRPGRLGRRGPGRPAPAHHHRGGGAPGPGQGQARLAAGAPSGPPIPASRAGCPRLSVPA
jgi:hypothetical protein